VTGRPSAADGASVELDLVDRLDEPTTVYIARRGRRVLYVGITGRNLRRMHAHARASDWWRQASRIELRHVPTRREALAIELQLIREWAPPFNVAGKPESEPEPERPPGLLDVDDLAALGLSTGARAVMRVLPNVVIGATHYVTESDYCELVQRSTYPPGVRP
jgi:predicted GIY-YIG superfamily endonuclease